MRYRRQKSVKGGRTRVGAGVIKEIDKAVNADAKHFKVSKSWVIACAVAAVYGIKIESYYEEGKPKKKRRLREHNLLRLVAQR